MTSVPTINQTNKYILYLLNTDDFNYTIKTLSLCMYVYEIISALSYHLGFFSFSHLLTRPLLLHTVDLANITSTRQNRTNVRKRVEFTRKQRGVLL
jgi:hypothetical protein